MANPLKPSMAALSGANANSYGIAMLCVGVFLFSIQDVIVKVLSDHYPVHELVFVRGLVALPLLLVMVHYDQGFASLKPDRPVQVLMRSLCMFISYVFFYLAVSAVSIPAAVALFFTAPLFITALSGPMLGETIGARRWAGVLVGFAGVVVMLRPGAEDMEPAGFLALLSALSYALSALLARRLGAANSASSMSFYTVMVFTYLGALMGYVIHLLEPGTFEHPTLRFLLGPWHMPDVGHMALLAAIGVISAAGFFLITQAYRIGTANAVAPFEYSTMIWAVLLTYLVWREVPDLITLAGVVLIVASGVYVLRRESVKSNRPLAAKGPYRNR